MTDQTGENPTEPTPEGSAAPPPVPPPAAPSAGTSSSSSYQFDADQARAAFQGAHKFDLGIMAAGVIAFLAGFMPFYKLSVNVAGFGGSGSWSAWHGFFGWFAVLVALGGAVVVALSLLNVVRLPAPTHQVAAAAFGLALVCLILALFVNPLPSCDGVPGCSTGHGFGYWLALLVVLGGTVLSVMRMRESTAMRPTTA
jgi:hypothetical protein